MAFATTLTLTAIGVGVTVKQIDGHIPKKEK
jgi:hypothetical protein